MRTLLVDGDLRRGGQHRSYGIALSPGFADVLGGKIAWRESVSQTTTASLSVLPAGTRSQRVPELLDRERLTRLIDEFRNSFDVVIIDSAPLGAGVDTYALSVAAGSMLMVLRYGTTQRKAADGRLTAVDQLPVRIIGAVLNGVPTTKSFGMYDAYAYLDDYALVGEGAPQPMLPRRDS
jgi:Mrp family chromosome partitioning ATPase